jgi:hypothetical protein
MNSSTGVDSAKANRRPLPMSIEQQQDELLDRIRDFHTEVDALMGPLSPEQATDLRRRYQALAAENERLHDLRLALN